MFNKVVVVDNTGMNDEAKAKLAKFSKTAIFYDDFPTDKNEIISRIGDADCLMVSYCTPITSEIINSCKNLKYIGMCCTLYNEKSSNVDIIAAKERGITVTGIKDYGDGGVIEFGVSSLIWLLHGFGPNQWKERPHELSNQKIGIIGLGTTGLKLAKALQFFGADLYYSDLARKYDAEDLGIKYLPLEDLLKTVDIISTHLPKNSNLLQEHHFNLLGNGKILLNTSIGPTFSVSALKKWLSDKNNFYICEDVGIGDCLNELKDFENVFYINKCAGSSVECTKRLSQKSIENVLNFLESEDQ